MSERSEFLPTRETDTQRREPEGQRNGVPFLCLLSLGKQRE